VAHDIVRVFNGLNRAGVAAIGAANSRTYDGRVRKPYHFDTGKVITGPITENAAAASNTRVVLLNGRTMTPVDAMRALGSSYEFRSVADNELGYFVVGVDLDGNFQPVVQGPVFPVAQ
jgi:hypothetical protein